MASTTTPSEPILIKPALKRSQAGDPHLTDTIEQKLNTIPSALREAHINRQLAFIERKKIAQLKNRRSKCFDRILYHVAKAENLYLQDTPDHEYGQSLEYSTRISDCLRQLAHLLNVDYPYGSPHDSKSDSSSN